MDPAERDRVVERLRAGASVALGLDQGARRRALQAIERELTRLGRTVVWVDLDGVGSGAELGGRIVEACLPYLDVDALGDVLEQLPARGRIDLEAFAELLMLPERVAARLGRRVVAILDGFQAVERVVGTVGLGVVAETLTMRARVAYLFVGATRVPQLFARGGSPLQGLAEVIEAAEPAGRRAGEPADRRAGAPGAVARPTSDDPLAAALLSWAEPPTPPMRQPQPPDREAWRRLIEQEERARRWLDEPDEDDDEHDEDDEDDEDDDWRRRRDRWRRRR
ncbi:MAG TPA: hypothetical protein VG370_32415 [Chloroflexota bacterium]|nr:hypothetical protein [Chloroflexota bacterium]